MNTRGRGLMNICGIQYSSVDENEKLGKVTASFSMNWPSILSIMVVHNIFLFINFSNFKARFSLQITIHNKLLYYKIY